MIHLKEIMTKKLKTLKEIVHEKGKLYLKFQIYLKEWLKVYKKRDLKGDKSVVKFIKHFGEIDEKKD